MRDVICTVVFASIVGTGFMGTIIALEGNRKPLKNPTPTYDEGFNDGVKSIIVLCSRNKEVLLTSPDGDTVIKCDVVTSI